MALATQAANSLGGDLAARAHLVAGTSAHLSDRPNRTAEYAALAAASAESIESREGALWLRVIRALEEQAPDLAEQLDDFRAAAPTGLKQSLRIATAELGVALVDGPLVDALDDARGVLAVAKGGADPIAHTGLLSAYSYALVVNAQYEEGLESTDALTSITESYAIEFPVRYAQITRVKALVGLRRFTLAERALSMLERQTRDHPGGAYLHGNLPVQRARLYASVGEFKRALDALSLGPPERASRTGRSEFLAWQALLWAIIGDSARATSMVADAHQAGRGLEARTLAHLAEAIIALTNERYAETAACLRNAIEGGAYDPIVIAVRAAPGLGAFIAEQPQSRLWLQRLLAASRDTPLATSLGLRIPREAKETTRLSPRETEVHELLAQGLTNEEISKLLYISLSTTKVHVKHIFEKLGVRSRIEAARALRSDV